MSEVELLKTAEPGNLNEIERCLDAGANINTKDKHVSTPTHTTLTPPLIKHIHNCDHISITHSHINSYAHPALETPFTHTI